MTLLALILGAYVLGAVPFGWVVGKVWGSIDVRQVGSGNIGTSNVMRTLGKGPALVVLFLDVMKGLVPVALAGSWGLPPGAVIAAGVAAVAGHVWPVFLRFKGGKGIATTLGVAIGLDGRLALLLLGLWLVVLILTRYISVASMTAAVALPFAVWGLGHPPEHVAGAAAIGVLALVRHRGNLHRLLSGTEYRFGERVQGAERR